ncbi:MAG: c-type cytochrome [Pseudomonadota bacterium]
MYRTYLQLFAIASLSTLSAAIATSGNASANQGSACRIAGLEKPPSICASHNRTLAATCFNCHGPDGRSNGAIPSLAGQSRSDIVNAMKEFRSGQRDEYATVMKKYALGYTDSEYEAMAEYFSNIK